MDVKVPESLLIAAGWGLYPRLIAEGARKAGVRQITVLGFRGGVDRQLVKMADKVELLPFGSLGRFFERVNANHCDAVMLGGQIRPGYLFRARFDDLARAEFRRMKVRNAHTLYGRLADMIAERGIEVLPASLFMADHIPREGLLTKRAPDEREQAAMRLGLETGMAVCNLDIGQTVIVKDGVVLAVEGFEGTDAAIKRGAKLGGRGVTVVKVAKEGHDMRFDIPVIGMRTMALLRRCRIRTLGLQAGRIVILEQQQVIAEADRQGIAIQAVESGLAHAPTVPRAGKVAPG